MSKIALEISRAIKEGKWLNIEYDNLEARTYFWIAIKDVNPHDKSLIVDMFNETKSMAVLEDRKIYFDKILSAYVIEGTTYLKNQDLIEKITTSYQDYYFLDFLAINERILSYYLECYNNDKELGVKNYTLIDGLDMDVVENPNLLLSNEGFEKAIRELKSQIKLDNEKEKQKKIKLAINVVSINIKQKLLPIVYRDVLLNVKEKRFEISNDFCFNVTYSLDDKTKINLKRYLDYDPQIFVDNFSFDPKKYIDDIMTNLNSYERIDELPYFFKLEKFIGINLSNEYRQIHKQYKENQLSPPLNAFFGSIDKDKKKKPKPILVSSNEVNVDQYRAIVNAMNKNIVYVQGPPGTGKSVTIVNVILSCLLNKQTCLISSNNNEAIDNIYRKMQQYLYRNQKIELPIIRLGSNENISKSLEKIHELYLINKHIKLDGYKEIIEVLEEQFLRVLEPLNELITNYEDQQELNEQIESLESIISKMELDNESDEISKKLAIAGIKAQIQNLRMSVNDINLNIESVRIDLNMVSEYLYYRAYQQFIRINNKNNQDLLSIITIEDTKTRLLHFTKFIKKTQGLKSLLDVFPVIISTNLGCCKLGECKPHFDLLVMDEASQSSNAISLLPLARAKRAMLVGDQNQLQPVVVLNTIKNQQLLLNYDIPYVYDYKNNSILSTLLSVDTISKFILLRSHYRCHPLIIGFSNQKYYDNELILANKFKNEQALKLINTNSTLDNEKNTSKEEVETVINEIINSDTKDIAVITPFKKQAQLLSKELVKYDLDFVKVGTIHTFQGDEKDKIIISSGISKKTYQSTFDWVKNNQELINVATTRAKKNLVLVADVNKVNDLSKENNDFYELMQYIRNNGQYQVNYNENELFKSKVKNFKYYNTKTEEEFLKVLMHLKSVYRQVIIETKVKISDVLDISDLDQELFMYGNQAHFDFVMYDLQKRPLLVIELVGKEHFNDEKVRKRDEKKLAICNRFNVKLISIKNDYVRRYLFIKETIIEVLKNE